MTVKAGKWLRVSSGGQDEQNQEPALDRYIAGHGYDLAKTYTVHGKSASKGQQQRDLDRVLADMRAGVIEVLVIWHSDRLERRTGKPHTSPLMDVLAEVHAAGGRVESEQEPMLGKLDMGSATMTFMAGQINAAKSVHLAEQVRIAHDRSRQNGALVGRPPWGYTSTGDKYSRTLVPTEVGRRLIPQIFSRVIAGESLDTIAKWLSAETGKPWWAKSVGVIVRNPTYMGSRCAWDVATRTYGPTLHRCEGLVDAAVWKRAGLSLDNRPKRGPVLTENRAQLAGVLFCPVCQMSVDTASPMYRITTRQGTFYRCAGRGAARKGCGNMVRLAEADAWVDQKIMTEWDRPIMVRKVIPGHDHAGEIESIRFEIRQLGTMDLDDDEYDRRLVLLRSERDRLVSLPSVPDQIVDEPTGENYADQWSSLSPSERAAFLKRNGILVMFSRDERAITWR